jgi:MFS family permease
VFILAGTVLLVPTTLAQGLIPEIALFGGLAPDSWLMFGARFFQGAAGAMVFAPALALAGDIAPDDRSGSTLSVLTMAFGFGVAFGPLISGFLVAWGFVVPFAVAAFLAAAGVVLALTQVEEVITPQRTIPLVG